MVKLVIQHKTASQIRKSPMQAPIYTQDTDTDTFETFYSSHQFQLETVACCQIYDHNQQWKTRANHTGGIWRKRDHTRSQYDFIKFKWFWKGKKKTGMEHGTWNHWSDSMVLNPSAGMNECVGVGGTMRGRLKCPFHLLWSSCPGILSRPW